jgi:hypothetical protein
MKIRILNLGLVSILLMIIIQSIAIFFELSGTIEIYMGISLNILYSVLNILVLIILWNVIVKFYKQLQFDFILKSIILILVIASFSSLCFGINLGKIGIMLFVIMSLINIILYFVFIHRLVEISKSEIKQIEQLKNYGLSFIICLFGQFILSAVIEFGRQTHLNFINHFLIIIPTIFIGLFFLKTMNEIKQK